VSSGNDWCGLWAKSRRTPVLFLMIFYVTLQKYQFAHRIKLPWFCIRTRMTINQSDVPRDSFQYSVMSLSAIKAVWPCRIYFCLNVMHISASFAFVIYTRWYLQPAPNLISLTANTIEIAPCAVNFRVVEPAEVFGDRGEIKFAPIDG